MDKIDLKTLWNLIESGREREIVLLRRSEYSYNEIAKLFDISHDDVVRIIQKIRERIEKYE